MSTVLFKTPTKRLISITANFSPQSSSLFFFTAYSFLLKFQCINFISTHILNMDNVCVWIVSEYLGFCLFILLAAFLDFIDTSLSLYI